MSDSESLIVLKSIDKKMDQVIKMLAINSVSGLDEVGKINALKSLGLTFEEIAAFLGTTPDAARMKLNRSKKSKPKIGVKNGR